MNQDVEDMKAHYESRKIKVPGAVIEATFSPGFSTSLSCWRLVIDSQGNLFQDVYVWDWTQESGIIKGRRQENIHIGVDVLNFLLFKVEEVSFQSYQDSYDASNVTDLASSMICIYVPTEKKVNTYGAGWLAYHGDDDMKGYVELWNAIHAYAPYLPPKS